MNTFHLVFICKFIIKKVIVTIPNFFKDTGDEKRHNNLFRIDFYVKEVQNHQCFLFASIPLGVTLGLSLF